MDYPAGESDDVSVRVDFDRRLKLEFRGSRITSDAGLLAYRELDDVLGLTDLAGGILSECRRAKNTRHLLTGLFRQSVSGRLAGCEGVNDADRPAYDPRRGGSQRVGRSCCLDESGGPLRDRMVDQRGQPRGPRLAAQRQCFSSAM